MRPLDRERRRHSIELVFILSLFLLFAISSITAILFGISIYSHTFSSMNRGYSSRTFTAYITEKIRQSDAAGSLYIDDSDDYERLVLTQTINGEVYSTSLYEYDGFLYELFSKADIKLSPDAGQKILPLSELDFEFASPTLLRVRYTDEFEKNAVVYVSLHSDK